MLTTASTHAFGQPDIARHSGELRPGSRLTCYVIQPGDTAAHLAQLFTGNTRSRHRPWFQIVNPATETYIPKSRYALIQSGWHVCVATEMLRPGSAQARYPLVASTAPALLQTRIPRQRTAIYPTVLWWAVPLLVVVSGLVFTWLVAGKYLGERQASLDTMRGFGDRFIAEFERPLFRRCASEPAVKSRLRLTPRRQTVEVLLAPAEGRTYPNLVDHRRNVEYDVERVLQRLRDASFTNGPLSAEGPWVVIPFRLETGRQQEGVP
jgi:hypothetical protein